MPAVLLIGLGLIAALMFYAPRKDEKKKAPALVPAPGEDLNGLAPGNGMPPPDVGIDEIKAPPPAFNCNDAMIRLMNSITALNQSAGAMVIVPEEMDFILDAMGFGDVDELSNRIAGLKASALGSEYSALYEPIIQVLENYLSDCIDGTQPEVFQDEPPPTKTPDPRPVPGPPGTIFATPEAETVAARNAAIIIAQWPEAMRITYQNLKPQLVAAGLSGTLLDVYASQGDRQSLGQIGQNLFNAGQTALSESLIRWMQLNFAPG